jgi:glutathione S-transferase
MLPPSLTTVSNMKLYYSPGACSLSPHIVLEESGLPFEPVLASTKTHKLQDGSDYYAISPKGYVPLLELDNGQRLSEGPAIVQYIADQVPAKKLAPASGTMERYRLQEWLNFITSELHKGIGGIFNAAMPEEAKQLMRDKAIGRLKWVDSQLEGKNYLMGDSFSVADAYLFTVTNWTKHTGIDISSLKNLDAFMTRMAARPAVQSAMKADALTLALAASAAGAAPAPGRYEATLCVRTAPAEPASCGAAVFELRADTRAEVRVADVVYRLRLLPSQVDVMTMQGKMEIDEFSARYEWRGKVLTFTDPDKGVRYEVRTGAQARAAR